MNELQMNELQVKIKLDLFMNELQMNELQMKIKHAVASRS